MFKRLVRMIPLLALPGVILAGLLTVNVKMKISDERSNGEMNRKYENAYKYKILPAGEIKPAGWIANQLTRDLNEGYIGSFNKVHPTVTHDVFVKQERLSKRKFSMRKEWWSGEHEGYWKDAVIRMAFLTHSKSFLDTIQSWVHAVINADDEGYIGIYSDKKVKGSRFNHSRENGELWVTSRMLMALLAYYEYTEEKRVLEAAEKAVKLVMTSYRDRNYFRARSRGGGVSHGVGFFESLEWLYRITGKHAYIDFARKLYNDFNNVEMRDDDLQTYNLLDENKKFDDHGAHLAEGLFIPKMIAAFDSSDVFQQAAKNVLPTLDYHTTPSGAMCSDEWVKERKGTADERYEYCGIAEMISPLNKMISFSGDLSIGDRIEKMTYNAGQGARFPVLKGLAYFSKDNRIKINHREIARREAYNAVHFAAACCVLNGGRLMPYYVEGMWMKNTRENGLAKVLYGPSILNTNVKDVNIRIEEHTSYPFSDKVKFTFHPEKPVNFPLELRKPFGCDAITLDLPEGAEVKNTDRSQIIHHEWKEGDTMSLQFNFRIQEKEQGPSETVKGNGVYFQRGPIVYAMPFEYTTKRVKEHRNSGFYSYRMKAKYPSGWNNKIKPGAKATFSREKSDKLNNPWDEPVQYIQVKMLNKDLESTDEKLVPMGNTVFRRVTFPVDKEAGSQ